MTTLTGDHLSGLDIATRGNLAVAYEAAGAWAGPSPYARLMACANT